MKAQRGFTLTELVIVMIITGVLAAVAVPRFIGQNEFATRAAHDFVVSSLRYAQKNAIASRRTTCAVMSATNIAVTYGSSASDGTCTPANVVMSPANTKPYSDVANALPNGITFSASTSIAFDPMGRATVMGGHTALTAPISVTLVGDPQPVTIEPESGLVR